MVRTSETQPESQFPKFVLGDAIGRPPRSRRAVGLVLGLVALCLAGGALAFDLGHVREKSASVYQSLAGSLAASAKLEPALAQKVTDPSVAEGQLLQVRNQVDTLRASLRTSEDKVAQLNLELSKEVRKQTDVLTTRADTDGATKAAIGKLNDMLDAAGQEKAGLERRIGKLVSELDDVRSEDIKLKRHLEDEIRKSTASAITSGQLTDAKAALDKAKLERADLERKLAEVQSQRADEIKAVRGEEAKALDEMLGEASAENDKLRVELAEARKRNADQSGTTSKQTQATQTIMNLERDLSLRDLKIKEQSETIQRYARDWTEATNRAANLENQVRIASATRAIWGAAAWSRKNGVIYALPNQTKEKSAIDAALAICAFKSRGPCELIRSFSNLCFSVARIDGQGARPDNWLSSVGETWQVSEAAAVTSCQQRYGRACTLRFTNCAPDGLSNPSSD